MKDVLSQVLAVVRPHVRFRSQANAYVDDELSPSSRERFETHTLRCRECLQAVEAVRRVKVVLAALPAEEAPRSFRLTPQMVSRPAAAVQRPRSATPLRFAQGATALAAFALLVVLSTGVFGSSSSQSETQPQSALRSSTENKTAASQQSAATAASSSGSVSGGNVATPAVGAAVVPQAAADRSAPLPAASGSPATAGAFGSASPEPLADSASARDQSPSHDHSSTNDGLGGRRWLELALLTVAIAAGAVWLRFSRTTRRDDP